MNRMTDWKVAGTLANGEVFSVIVRALYGYRAMTTAEKLVGKIATASAMRVEHLPK